MSKSWQQDILTVLDSTHIAFLSSQGKTGPETSMTPFAVYEDSILLHLSELAKHTKNIKQHPEVGLMICTPETKDISPLALPRLSLQGNIHKISALDANVAKDTYLAKLPDAEPLFSFSDFSIYQMKVHHVHWVGGFGKARKVSIETWRTLFC